MLQNCSKPPAASFNATVLAGTATPFRVPSKPGKWFVAATYSGDQLNLPSAGACGSEVITVLPAKATIRKTSVSKGTITTTLTVNDPGKITITAVAVNAKAVYATAHRCKPGKTLIDGKCVSTLFGTASLTVTAVGTFKIKLHPDKAAKRALANGHTIPGARFDGESTSGAKSQRDARSSSEAASALRSAAAPRFRESACRLRGLRAGCGGWPRAADRLCLRWRGCQRDPSSPRCLVARDSAARLVRRAPR